MAFQEKLIGLPPETLRAISAAAQAAIIAGLTRGTSYTIAGRSFGFSTISECVGLINECEAALRLANGTGSQCVVANFNRGMGRGSR